MSVADFESVGDVVHAARAIAHTAWTAGDSTDANNVAGVIIDRGAYNYSRTMALAVPFYANLTATKKLTIKDVYIEHADYSNFSGSANYANAASMTSLANQDVATATGNGCAVFNVYIGGAKRYIRCNVTPDLSNTGTDTAYIAGVAVFGIDYSG